MRIVDLKYSFAVGSGRSTKYHTGGDMSYWNMRGGGRMPTSSSISSFNIYTITIFLILIAY